jgi:uncharacterized protein (DUF2141 family)
MKRSALVSLAVIFFVSNVKSQSKVIAEISNLRNDKGVCRACLFNNAASFKGEAGQPFACATTAVKNKNAVATFQNVPAGDYALFVFHDENSNNKIDKNFLGIPKEGYGASKNKLPFAGAPTFNDNRFTVENNNTARLLVKIRNL